MLCCAVYWHARLGGWSTSGAAAYGAVLAGRVPGAHASGRRALRAGRRALIRHFFLEVSKTTSTYKLSWRQQNVGVTVGSLDATLKRGKALTDLKIRQTLWSNDLQVGARPILTILTIITIATATLPRACCTYRRRSSPSSSIRRPWPTPPSVPRASTTTRSSRPARCARRSRSHTRRAAVWRAARAIVRHCRPVARCARHYARLRRGALRAPSCAIGLQACGALRAPLRTPAARCARHRACGARNLAVISHNRAVISLSRHVKVGPLQCKYPVSSLLSSSPLLFLSAHCVRACGAQSFFFFLCNVVKTPPQIWLQSRSVQ